MIVDLNAVGKWPFEGRHDVCVCGTGPAGVTVARELARQGRRVLLLEAGGFDLANQSQDVYEAKSVGAMEYLGANNCRLRMFGGTSNHWSGRCGVFDRIDFEARDIWEVPGWPISYDDAYRRLDDAREILDIAGQSLKRPVEPNWRDAHFSPAAFARSAPTRIGEKYRAELEASGKIDVAINANVIGAAFSRDGGVVASITVCDYQDRHYEVSADYYVLAFGSLENARFLLNVGEATGVPVGNRSDYVGRCFMEHFDIKLGRFTSFDAPIWERDEAFALNAAEDVTRARKMGTAVVNVDPGAIPRFYGRLAPFRRLSNDMRCAANNFNLGGQAKRTSLCRGDGVVTNIIEQTPNPMSRIILDTTARDRFGHFRIAIDWRITDQDVSTITRLAEEIGKSLATQDIARFQISGDIRLGKPRPGFHCHQMGTTRMSASPKDGVVDPNQKVHGTDNLYVAGSSVFSTGGGINPTLTLTALSLRLGEHIAARFS